MNNDQKNKSGMIILLIFLLICSGLGIAAFTMSFRNCNKDGFMPSTPPECPGGTGSRLLCDVSTDCPHACPVCDEKSNLCVY